MNDLFPILAVETSGMLCSVALILDEKDSIELNYLQNHIHSKKLIWMIDSVLKSGDKQAGDLKSIAVSMGPGSFTGLRIGLAAAKGMAFGAGLPVIPVPTYEAFALQISKYLSDESKFSIAVGANTDEFYFVKYRRAEKKSIVMEELRLISKIELEKSASASEKIFGNFVSNNVNNPPNGPSAKSVGEWAYLYGKDLLTFDYDYLEPNYFKKFIVKAKK